MWTNLLKVIWLSVLILVGGVGIYIYEEHYATERKVARLEAEKKELEEIISRLSAERRVAEMLVTSQTTDKGVLKSQVLFVEYAKNGEAMPGKVFEVLGKSVHVDALVIKFDRDFVKKDDPLKGKSVALFTRIYGDNQSPADGGVVDREGEIPGVYRGEGPATEFEGKLWKDFWRLAEDSEYRKEFGVRVAQGEGPWAPLEPNRLYTLTLEAAGGLNLTSEPLKGIYREAMKPAGK